MSDQHPPSFEFSPAAVVARRRAAWTLGLLAAAALAVIAVIYLVSGSPSHSSPGGLVVPTGPAVTHVAPGGAASTSSSSSFATSPTNTPSTSASSTPTLTGDGGLLAAMNSLRSQHHLPAVTGTISPAAQTCASHDGDTGSCPSTYFWEPVGSQSGAAVIQKIASHADGIGWLLNTKLTAIGIGWSHVGDGWQCAVIQTAPAG